MPQSRSRTLVDHEEIRRWAEERGGQPACVRGTGGDDDVGMIRLDFPGYSGEESLEPIEWDDWFDKFDERKLALLVQDETASGQQSNFNKLVAREAAEARDRGEKRRASRRSVAAHAKSTDRSRGRRTRSASRSSASGRATRTASARGGQKRSRSARSTRAVRSSSRQSRRNGAKDQRGSRSASRAQSKRPQNVRGSKSRAGSRRRAA